MFALVFYNKELLRPQSVGSLYGIDSFISKLATPTSALAVIRYRPFSPLNLPDNTLVVYLVTQSSMDED
jgi:hypothetical protein